MHLDLNTTAEDLNSAAAGNPLLVGQKSYQEA